MASKRIAVLGGGISGLSAAWNLLRCSTPVEVTVYEAASRVGGWLETTRTSSGGLFELGPRSLRTAGLSARATMEMVSQCEFMLLHNAFGSGYAAPDCNCTNSGKGSPLQFSMH